MKDRVYDKICPYCAGHIIKTQNSILVYDCLKCGESLTAAEAKEKDGKAAKQ